MEELFLQIYWFNINSRPLLYIIKKTRSKNSLKYLNNNFITLELQIWPRAILVHCGQRTQHLKSQTIRAIWSIFNNHSSLRKCIWGFLHKKPQIHFLKDEWLLKIDQIAPIVWLFKCCVLWPQWTKMALGHICSYNVIKLLMRYLMEFLLLVFCYVGGSVQLWGMWSYGENELLPFSKYTCFLLSYGIAFMSDFLLNHLNIYRFANLLLSLRTPVQ